MLKKMIWMISIFMISSCYFLNQVYSNNRANVFLASEQTIVEQEEEIAVNVEIQNAKIAACNFSIYFDPSKVAFIANGDNINVLENRINFVWFDSLGGNGAKEGTIATFKFRALQKGLATFTVEGEFYGGNGQLLETDFKEWQCQIGKEESNLQKQAQEEQGTNLENANCNLQVLRLDTEGLVPPFNEEIEEYYLTIPNSIQDIEILAISENPNAMVEIKGNKNLQEGLNDITVQVTSADKTQNKVYTIHVSRTANLDLANTNLEILAIENVLLNPPFDASQTNYKIEVSNQTESLTIFAVPENEQAVVEIFGKDNVKEGDNLVLVEVTAPNGFTKKTYKIEAYKRNLEEEKSYQEEQEKRKEELDNAYQLEKTASAIHPVQEEMTNKQNKKYQFIGGGCVIIGFIVLLVIGVIWRNKRKK